jgi:hypothetical protein
MKVIPADQEKKTAKFECIAKQITGEELTKLRISEASIQEDAKTILGGEMPDHPSIMLFKGPLANGGKINKNGHGVAIADLVKFYKKFNHTPVNQEHNRGNTVGFIVKSYLTKHNSEEKLSNKAAMDSLEPIDVSVVFAVWNHLDPALSTVLGEVTNPENPSWGLIRLSWECAYSAYNLLVGSYDTFTGELIEDEGKITEMEKYLLDNGGTGKTEDGKPVSLLLADGDSILPLGCGLVVHPAADVGNLVQVTGAVNAAIAVSQDENDDIHTSDMGIKAEHSTGTVILDKTTETSSVFSPSEVFIAKKLLQEIKDTKEEFSQKITEISLNNQKSEVKSSHSENNIVKPPSMKITSFEQITDEVIENKEVTASDIRLIAEELEKKCAAHQAEVEAKNTELTTAKESADAALKEVDTIKLSLEAVTKELDEMKAANAAAKAEFDFNTRMTALNDEFELSDEDREVIAGQIKSFDDEGFASWKKSFDIIAKQKSKEFIKANIKEVKASTEEVVVEAPKVEATPVVADPLDLVKAHMVPVPGAVQMSEDAVKGYRDAFKAIIS